MGKRLSLTFQYRFGVLSNKFPCYTVPFRLLLWLIVALWRSKLHFSRRNADQPDKLGRHEVLPVKR